MRRALASTHARRTVARTAPALLAAAALVTLGLTGCSASGSGASCVQPGDASNLVRASGDFGSPSVSFPTPLESATVQKSTLKKGSGATISDGDVVVGKLAYSNGKTGKALGASGTFNLVIGGSSATGLGKALACSTAGSRVAVTGTVKELFGAGSNTGLKNSTTAVFVLDLKKVYPSRATGEPRPSQPGMPTVVLAPNGRPGIKIPSNDAPTKLRTAVLKQGSGATITKVTGSHGVLVNFTSVAWNDPDTVAASSWSDGSPVVWSSTSGSSVPADVVKQLIGHKVGSQIIVVTPGSNATAYVIDILGIWK